MDIIDIIKAAFFTPTGFDAARQVTWGLTLLFWGKPGVGKSARIKQVAKQWGLECKVLSPGTDGEGAFGCTPVPDGRTISYPAPYWTADVAGGGVVFLDEVNQASPALQAAIMGIALDNRIGDCVLDGKVRRIAAANPVDYAAGGWDLAPPVANRFGHFDWGVPSTDDWCSWLLGSTGENEVFNAGEEEARVLAEWAEPWARAAGLVSAFVRARPALLCAMPDLGNPALGRAWPSPRSWEMAARALASSTVHGHDAATREYFVSGFCGDAAAQELFTYASALDLPDPAAVLDGKVPFVFDPKRLDRTSAVISGCTALVCDPGCQQRDERVERLWTLLSSKKLLSEGADIVFLPVKALLKARLHRHPAAMVVLKLLSPILTAAGV